MNLLRNFDPLLKKFEPLWHIWLKNAIYFFPYIGIGIGSVSADMKKYISVIYRIGQFRKWDLSVLIGIGRYGKKLIGHTLSHFYGGWISLVTHTTTAKCIILDFSVWAREEFIVDHNITRTTHSIFMTWSKSFAHFIETNQKISPSKIAICTKKL